jgi:hypothetical protein
LEADEAPHRNEAPGLHSNLRSSSKEIVVPNLEDKASATPAKPSRDDYPKTDAGSASYLKAVKAHANAKKLAAKARREAAVKTAAALKAKRDKAAAARRKAEANAAQREQEEKEAKAGQAEADASSSSAPAPTRRRLTKIRPGGR